MKKIIHQTIACVLILSMIFTGCLKVDMIATGTTVPVLMNEKIERPHKIIKHFSVDHKAIFTLFDLIPIHPLKLDMVVQNEIQNSDGDAVINLRLKGVTTIEDKLVPYLLSLLITLGFPAGGFISFFMIGVRTYEVEGDIIQYTDGKVNEKKVEPTPEKKIIVQEKKEEKLIIDPMTGLPVKKEEKKTEFDPETGLPK